MARTIEDVLVHGLPQRQTSVLCPFHDDQHNPSGRLYPDGSYWCFSCGAYCRDVIDYVIQTQFPDEADQAYALRLAKSYIIEHFQYNPNGPRPRRQPRPPGPPRLFVKAMSLFAHAARENLERHPELERAIARERGLTSPTALGIGLAEQKLIMSVRRKLGRQGYGHDAIEAALEGAGITRHGQYRLGERILIPETRPEGVLFYQARTLLPDQVKYLNPPDLPKPLYGWQSLHRKNPMVWIGEGSFDIMPLLEAGASAIAPMGADVSGYQLHDVVSSIGDRSVIVAFDNDEAGATKGERLVAQLAERNIRAQYLPPPPGYKDYGEWLTDQGAGHVMAACF